MTDEPKFNEAEIEAGRLLFARPFTFIKGCVRIADLPDPVFAQGIMGDGVALDPEEVASVTALAPCDGSVAKVFPGGHGIAIESSAGPVLLHLGLDGHAKRGADRA